MSTRAGKYRIGSCGRRVGSADWKASQLQQLGHSVSKECDSGTGQGCARRTSGRWRGPTDRNELCGADRHRCCRAAHEHSAEKRHGGGRPRRSSGSSTGCRSLRRFGRRGLPALSGRDARCEGFAGFAGWHDGCRWAVAGHRGSAGSPSGSGVLPVWQVAPWRRGTLARRGRVRESS